MAVALLFIAALSLHAGLTGQAVSPCPERLRDLLPSLQSDSLGARASAADDLGALGAEGACAVPALRMLLRTDPDENVQEAAARALGNIGPPALVAAPDLMEAALRLERPKSALDALPKLGPGVIPILLPWLDETIDAQGEHQGNGGWAAIVYGEIGAPAVPALIQALRTPSRIGPAADSLGVIGPAAAGSVPALVSSFGRARDSFEQYAIFRALGKIGPAAGPAVPFLQKQLADLPGDPQTNLLKAAAIEALAKIQGAK
jgi:HEAT repeat protein